MRRSVSGVVMSCSFLSFPQVSEGKERARVRARHPPLQAGLTLPVSKTV